MALILLRPQWTALAPAGLALAALVGAAAGAFAAGPPNEARWALVGWYAAMWAAFAVAVVLLLRRPRQRGAVGLVLAGGVLLQAVAVAFPPRSTDDYYRYAWDGIVQTAGVDPYRYAPTDPALAGLRTDWLFPPGCRATDCTRLNHPQARTIYPPVAQAEFTLVRLITPRDARDKPWQLTAALLALLTTAALLTVLRRAGRDPRWAALWAWCPAVAIDAGNAAHVDVLGVLLTITGLAALATAGPGGAGRAGVGQGRRAALLGGVLLGAAVGVKLLPALVLPAVPRRGRVLAWAAAGAVLALAYLPHVLAVGPKVLGYLPGYLREEGFDGAGRYPLLRLLGVPPDAAAYLAAAILIAVAIATLRTTPAHPADTAVAMTGTAFLLIGPTYPWYALLLAGLIALSGHWYWLPVTAVSYPGYLTGALHIPYQPTTVTAYAVAAALTLLLRLRWHGAAAAPPGHADRREWGGNRRGGGQFRSAAPDPAVRPR